MVVKNRGSLPPGNQTGRNGGEGTVTTKQLSDIAFEVKRLIFAGDFELFSP
jgi:hypothetical protein